MHPSLNVRVDLRTGGRIGPGKVELLEQIALLGSISAAGRAMSMSYRRAWELVEEMNQICGSPLTESQIGGKGGGGAALTLLGHEVVRSYRAIERAADRATRSQLSVLEGKIKDWNRASPQIADPTSKTTAR